MRKRGGFSCDSPLVSDSGGMNPYVHVAIMIILGLIPVVIIVFPDRVGRRNWRKP